MDVIFAVNLISRVISVQLWLWGMEKCSQFIGNLNWTQGSVHKMNYFLLMMHMFTFYGQCYLLNGKGKILVNIYCINTTRVKFWWRLTVKGVFVRDARSWIFVTFLSQIKLDKKNYASNIFQQMRCGEISWKIQCKEQSLGNIGTTDLVETNKVFVVRKNIHQNYIIFRCLILIYIINCSSIL